VIYKLNNRLIGLILAIVFIMCLFVLMLMPKGEILVQVSEVKKGELLSVVNATGTVVPSDQRIINSQLDGFIKSIGAKEGRFVNKNDFLAEIEASSLVGNVRISSPINGKVLFIPDNIKPGERVQMGQEMFVVGDTFNLKVMTNVNEEDSASIKVGQQVKIHADYLKEISLGVVKKVGLRLVNENNATVLPVEIEMTSIMDALPGNNVDVDIETAYKRSVMYLPVQAIYTNSEGQKFIYLVRNGKVQWSQVGVGIRNLDFIQIIPPISVREGDVVITWASVPCKNGSRVKILASQQD